MKNYQKPRPTFPEKAVITAGMPYGNKSLHFGHIGGVFIQADTFTRFLKDRIGKDNVLFVSGTDCYGSPIVASHKKETDETGETIALTDYVNHYHKLQSNILASYEVAPSLYGASALGKSADVHAEVSKEVFQILMAKGTLKKFASPQFYDTESETYLNGRQVTGKCPFEGCQSDKGYADECSLGHQYMPSELIDPISTLSGTTPSLKMVENWYFDLPSYRDALATMGLKMKASRVRDNFLHTLEEFLKAPAIHITRKEFQKLMDSELTFEHSLLIDEPKKPSVTYEFESLDQRDAAREVLDGASIRYRSGKTLVPFRLSGNIDWGVPVPNTEGMEDLTFWVWPESLWAPISFVKTHLASNPHLDQNWQSWMLNDSAKLFQFIGEDNIYFYGIAEMAMLMAYCDAHTTEEITAVNYPTLIANCHLLFLDTKASSSGDIKPPMADELLNFYTSDQLRMHFLSLGLSKRSVSFNPKPFNPAAPAEEQDVVLKDGNLLTNVFNRICRSCFYTAQKYADSRIPTNEVSEEMLKVISKGILDYEDRMAQHEFHKVIYTLDELIRFVSKYWAKHMKQADTDENQELRLQILADTFYAVKCITTLLHPIVPASAEALRNRLCLNENLWDWSFIFEPIAVHMTNPLSHEFEAIPPQYDFFERHPSQL